MGRVALFGTAGKIGARPCLRDSRRASDPESMAAEVRVVTKARSGSRSR
jgi:hypothetical protein